MPEKTRGRGWGRAGLAARNAAIVVVLFVSACFVARYLQVEPMPLVRMATFVLAVVAWRRTSLKDIRPRARRALVIYCLLLSASLVVGYHIHVSDPYHGTYTTNTFTPMGPLDALALPFLVPVPLALLSWLYCRLTARAGAPGVRGESISAHLAGVSPRPRRVVLAAALLFALWLPYLLAYWPGFLFGDSLESVKQALGLEPWSNHFPVLYTAFIKLCLWLGQTLFASHTVGVAIYSLAQMATMAAALAYLFEWVTVRLSWPWWATLVQVGVLGANSYVATYSISMWKDPFFAVALVLLTLMLADLLLGKHDRMRGRIGLLPFALVCLATIFTRNNGIYIVLLVCVVFLVYLRKSSMGEDAKREWRAHMRLGLVLVAACWAITSPLYTHLGLNTDGKVESYGVLINQMARVVVTGGDMTGDDRAYMDEMLPYYLYYREYTPCSVDSLKWDVQFDNDALEHDFFRHWLSMGLKNPGTYFEAWAMNTYGFWTINCPDINVPNATRAQWNIYAGIPVNTEGGYAETMTRADIHTQSLIGLDARNDLLHKDEWSVPVGWIAWGIAFLCICLAGSGNARWIMTLLPCLALLATLAVASPINYWARYGLVAQLLIPYLGLLLVALWRGTHDNGAPDTPGESGAGA